MVWGVATSLSSEKEKLAVPKIRGGSGACCGGQAYVHVLWSYLLEKWVNQSYLESSNIHMVSQVVALLKLGLHELWTTLMLLSKVLSLCKYFCWPKTTLSEYGN